MKPSIFQINELEAFLLESGLTQRDLRPVRRRFFREYVGLAELGLPESVLAAVEDRFQSGFLKVVHRRDSDLDGATKLILETHDGFQIETVILRIASGRVSVCVSSQVGCSEACRFCATGDMGFRRNLSVDEILDQVMIAGRLLAQEDRRIRNLVFMGMGEPLRNPVAVSSAVHALTTGSTFQFVPKYITVSTSGLAERLLEFAGEHPEVSLALSLNAPDDVTREAMMPVNKRHDMAELRATLERLEEIRGSGIMIEYIMFQGVNDSLDQADQVGAFLKGLDVHINLIPYNADMSADSSFVSSDTATIVAFKERLESQGYTVTRRFSLGQDIAAACGQLANNE